MSVRKVKPSKWNLRDASSIRVTMQPSRRWVKIRPVGNKKNTVMKKNLFLAGILFLSSAAISTSCSSSDSSLDNTTSTKVKEVTITTKVANTRVSYTYNNGLVPQWETTDRLIVYRGSISSGNKSGDFTPDNITTLPESSGRTMAKTSSAACQATARIASSL